jgi:hypothetical protein
MGTPHRGAGIARCFKVVGNFGNFITMRSIRTALLSDLSPNSKKLGEISMQFANRMSEIQIVSMYERKPTRGVLVCHK